MPKWMYDKKGRKPAGKMLKTVGVVAAMASGAANMAKKKKKAMKKKKPKTIEEWMRD